MRTARYTHLQKRNIDYWLTQFKEYNLDGLDSVDGFLDAWRTFVAELKQHDLLLPQRKGDRVRCENRVKDFYHREVDKTESV